MEIKHTVEILTKDIQEIEKLVRNLNNSPVPPRIELDLALSKLRNVYELLTMIRTDAEEEAVSEPSSAETTEGKAEIPQPEEDVKPQAVQQELHIEEPLLAKATEDKPSFAKATEGKAEILAEKFNHDTSINENIASAADSKNVTSKITHQPIDNIGRNIGINDRFLIIRELFEGNNDNFTQLISQLDSCTSAEEAIGILELSFPGGKDHEGFQLLAQLARRKFI